MFKETFKYYKAKWPEPDFSEVLNFEESPRKGAREVEIKQNISTDCIPFGVKSPQFWKCYELHDRPGLIFLQNPFTASGQRYWIARCLRDYPRSPNVVNLSPKMFDEDVLRDWWGALQGARDSATAKKLKTSMRWTTLGYHHDWDTKVYSEEMKHQFPGDLGELSAFFAEALGFGRYSAEAAIVNFYPIGTTLAGHTDHSEADLEAPLFSFSFGQTAIFLIGGPTKEEKPSAIFLKSGDVVVMSKSSRLCYHAVPRVMKSTSDPWNHLKEEDLNSTHDDSDGPPERKRSRKLTGDPCSMDLELWSRCSDNKFWSPFNNYLDDCRININLEQRQVRMSNMALMHWNKVAKSKKIIKIYADSSGPPQKGPFRVILERIKQEYNQNPHPDK